MRPDQKQRLDDLAELLVEEFIAEADPRLWPGAGKPPDSWTKEERGDRVWVKRNVIGTGSVLHALHDLEDRHEKNTSADAATQGKRDDDLDASIAKYEGQAARLLEKVQNSVKP